MNLKLLFFFILCTVVTEVHAQTAAERYKDAVFKSVKFTANESYKSGQTATAKKRDYLLDIYEPSNDEGIKRPLVIWLHGGGFKFGNKRSRGIPIWSRSFARRGYVCIAMNYRKSSGIPVRNYNDMLDGCYSAMEDLGHLVEWCKKNAEKLRIDTGKIIVAGNSAGSIVALQSAYTSLFEMGYRAGKRDSSKLSHVINPNNIGAVINFWGAIFDSTWLHNSQVPVVSVHGTDDGIVPYEHEDMPLYGSAVVHRQADKLNIPNVLKSYKGYRHELQRPFHPFVFGKKAKKRWLDAGQFAADFLYENVLAPQHKLAQATEGTVIGK